MSSRCCNCAKQGPQSLPLVYLVPHPDTTSSCNVKKGLHTSKSATQRTSATPLSSDNCQISTQADVRILDDDYIRKHFNLPPRALYLDPFRRPLITFPMTQEMPTASFNMAKKTKINQQILDGLLDPSEAVMAPTPFPFPPTTGRGPDEKTAEDEETIYILQLPDWEFQCPLHNKPVRTPRFIWHSTKKSTSEAAAIAHTDAKDEGPCGAIGMKQGGGALNKPKPWLLSRLTDFDFTSQW